MQLESAQGGADDEAAEALTELKEKMAILAAAEANAEAEKSSSRGEATPPNDVQLASALDR